ncbi:MAG TPA: SDR family oxidoreductase [Tepidisphaeraceae bacterium]|nr:SDR family oxidoreductase [Tepidisphaeraceae bacterium]
MALKTRRVALVTGGAIRVGRAIVRQLNEMGFDIGFTYHSSASEANRLAKSLAGRSIAIQADLTQPKHACKIVLDEMTKTFGRLDVLVNNASIYVPGNQQSKQMMAIHFGSPRLLGQLFEKQLRKSKGHIVNMVDALAKKPPKEFEAYGASKSALWDLTLEQARQLGPEVTVNGIAPGVVEWPKGYPMAARRRYLRHVPLNRAGTPEDVAKLVAFLVTDGTYINGQIIRLDGGRSISQSS